MQPNQSGSPSHRSNRCLLFSLALAVVTGPPLAAAEDGPVAARARQLRVSDDGRWLQYRDGSPFFYLADTAWELFHRLDREEAELYLRDRADKGFTVIQAVALAELDGLDTPNAYGHRPLRDNDPRQPEVREGSQNDYWDHVDFIIARASSLNLFVGLLPTWGDKWQGGGRGPVVFDRDNARLFGQWLGERYRDAPIIWILGGDRNIYSDTDRQRIAAMAQGLRAGDGGAHLITYHPRGPGRSSDYFHHAPWLDFNMFQSSHAARDHDNGLFARHDYRLHPPKPTLDGEPRYEGLRVGFYNQGAPRNVYFDDYDARQAAWWSVLAGACGHTYGNGNIWQMWQPGREPVLGANVSWQQALHHPGARQMGHLRRLLRSRPFIKLVPADTLLLDGPERGGGKVRAARAGDGSFALVYSPRGEQFSVQMSQLARKVRATWFDPRYGTAYHLHTSDNTGIQTFVPPTCGRGQDWVLVLDDDQAGYPVAGQEVWHSGQ